MYSRNDWLIQQKKLILCSHAGLARWLIQQKQVILCSHTGLARWPIQQKKTVILCSHTEVARWLIQQNKNDSVFSYWSSSMASNQCRLWCQVYVHLLCLLAPF